MANVLVVDDDTAVRFTLEEVLTERGHRVVTAKSGREALSVTSAYDVVITDLVMPEMGGLELLSALQQRDKNLPVILLTAKGSERIAVTAMKSGAYDYLAKPFDIDEVVVVIERAAETVKLRQTVARNQLEQSIGHAIIGQSPSFAKVLDTIQRVGPKQVSVLIRGETGTGKELIATLVHVSSPRKNKPLIRFNCAALPDSLAESELFGHQKGSFTGAHQDRKGYFTAADGGSIFLDEVGELSLSLQAKLLRVVQLGEVQPLGKNQPQRVDVRIIAATHRDLQQLVQQGKFREDLYYRLNVVEVTIPPLRQRPEDIPLLVEYFHRKYARQFGLDYHSLPEGLMDELTRYHWPGNVRELENQITKWLALSSDGVIDTSVTSLNTHAPIQTDSDGQHTNLRQQVQQFERSIIETTLAKTNGNQSEAARRLGITRTTLIDKLKRLGIRET